RQRDLAAAADRPIRVRQGGRGAGHRAHRRDRAGSLRLRPGDLRRAAYRAARPRGPGRGADLLCRRRADPGRRHRLPLRPPAPAPLRPRHHIAMIPAQLPGSPRPAVAAARAIAAGDRAMTVIHDFARWLLWIVLIAGATIGLYMASHAL